MGIFAARGRRVTTAARDQEGGVPLRFEAVGEALAAGADARTACSVVGRELARDGVGLGEALRGLRDTARLVTGEDPAFEPVHALCAEWAEETLSFVNQLSCENPLTGLASLAHLRARLTETYRGAQDCRLGADQTHALVVIDVPGASEEDHFDRALLLVRLAETVRLVFPGSETLGQVGTRRLLLLTTRTADLGIRVANMRGLVGDLGRPVAQSRVWIEGLPSTTESAARLLDELAR